MFFFIDLRLQLLEPNSNHYIVKALNSILMILPQSEAFKTLQSRLQCVSQLHHSSWVICCTLPTSYYAILYYVTLHSILSHAIPCCTTSNYAALCHTTLYSTKLCHTILYYTMSHYTLLYYVIL